MRAATNCKIMHEITKSMLPLVPRRSVVDELRCFLIEANKDDGSITVTANNMESAMQRRFTASVESGGRFVMDARMLVNILAHLEGETVEFAASARTVDITGGTCTYTMNTLACDGFPHTAIPFPGRMSVAFVTYQLCDKAILSKTSLSKFLCFIRKYDYNTRIFHNLNMRGINEENLSGKIIRSVVLEELQNLYKCLDSISPNE